MTMSRGAGRRDASGPSSSKRRTALAWGIVFGALVTVILLGLVAVVLLKATVFAPRVAAQKYLSDLAAGRASAAATLVHAQPRGGAVSLLTDDALRNATERISRPVVDSVDVFGHRARAHVSYRLDGAKHHASLELESTSATLWLFDDWTLAHPLVDTVAVSAPVGTRVTVAGVTATEPEGGTLQFSAYPGRYPVVTASGTYFRASDTSVTAGGSHAAATANVTVEPTQALRTAVHKRVKETIDDCASSTSADPKDCPFQAFSYSTVPVRWHVERYPKLRFDDAGGFDTATPGAVRAQYTDEFFGEELPHSDSEDVYVKGTAEVTEGHLTISVHGY